MPQHTYYLHLSCIYRPLYLMHGDGTALDALTVTEPKNIVHAQ